MSSQLHDFAMEFATGEISAEEFVDPFMERWRRERDSGGLADDPDEVSERLSSIFCLADLYNPEADRAGYELDESGLRSEIRRLMKL